MSKKKSYCIILKEGYAYFPIKAKSGPYKDKSGRLMTGYLAGMPNFFGGTAKANIYSALKKEMAEESQGNIEIQENVKIEDTSELLLHFNENGSGDSIDYSFYIFLADKDQQAVTIKGFENSNILMLSTDERLPSKYREMGCILKIPVDQLKKDFSNFLDKCIEVGGGYLWDKSTIENHLQWNEKGTKNAFKVFCENYGV